MDNLTIVCDQAIFTSARGPTGEGYRIVAASKGLRADEKQKITRCSPSHESLCSPAENDAAPVGTAFYPLPGGRFCVAASRHAGAEHSGRGGQRVYTHNLVISAADFESLDFNPFNLIRSLPATEIELPKLPSGAAIPALELNVTTSQSNRITPQSAALLPAQARQAAVQQLLDAKPIVMDLPQDWQTWAEALLLSVPAPLRPKLSFSAGIRYSAGRGHTLSILRDEKNAVQNRVVPQGLCFLSARSSASAPASVWPSFVDRHWTSGDLSALARRTSRKFEDCTHPARERVAEIYNATDDLAQTESPVVLDLVFRSFNAPQAGVETEIHREFRDAAQRQLLARFGNATWTQVKPIWFRLVEFWRNGGQAALFAQPLLNLALVAALRSDPLAAGELAFSIAQLPDAADPDAHESTMRQVLGRLAALSASATPEDAERLARLATRWRAFRPNCPLVAQMNERIPVPQNVR